MADLGIQEKRGAPSETPADAPLAFRFEVTWHSLTPLAEPARAPLPKPSVGAIAKAAPPREVVKERKPVLPFAKSRPAPEPSPVEPARPLVEAPAFGMAVSNNAPSPKWRIFAILGLVGALILIAAMTIGRGSPSRDAGPSVTSEMGEGGWLTEWVSDKRGSALGRQLSLYRPSLKMSDYRLDFTGRILHNSLGWVFRVEDTKNYYVGKVSDSGGRLILTRFAVIHGVEGPRTRNTLPLLAGVGALRVRLDARRSRFTIYLQNEVVDDWQDERIPTGGVGFVNERDEQGQVDSVQISFLNGASDK